MGMREIQTGVRTEANQTNGDEQVTTPRGPGSLSDSRGIYYRLSEQRQTELYTNIILSTYWVCFSQKYWSAVLKLLSVSSGVKPI